MPLSCFFFFFMRSKRLNIIIISGYGMTLGFPTILIPAVKNPKDGELLHLEDSEISWISKF